MGAGESARREAESLKQAEARLRAKADYLAKKAEAYLAGADGEDQLYELAKPLRYHGYYGLPDLGVPGKESNIDLVLVGPAGVFVMDSKRWSGRLTLAGELKQDGRRRGDAVEGVMNQAALVAAALHQAFPGEPIPVWPVLAFTGSASIGGYQVLGRVALMDGANVVESVGRFPVVYGASDVDRIQDVVQRAFASRTSSSEDASDDGRSFPPSEPVVFVTPWAKHGYRRLYVRDEEGFDGGFIDLVKGELVGTSAVANQVLGQMVPHFAGSSDELTTEEGQRVAAAFAGLDSGPQIPLVAGFRWIGYGRERLYVHYLGPGTQKLDLGWVDLRSDRVHGEVTGVAPIVRYCGERYQATRPTRR